MQTRVHRGLVAALAGGGDAQGIVQELVRAAPGLLCVAFLERLRQFQQRFQAARLGHYQVAEVAGERAHEVQGVESLGQNLVQHQKSGGVVSGEEGIHQLETVFVVQDVQVADDVLVFHLRAAEGHRLVKDGEGVAHGTIGLGGYYVQGFVVNAHPFLFCDAAQVPYHVRNADPVEVIGLAAAQDGGENLVLLRSGKDENGMCRRFLQGFEEGVERRLGEHVYLVYNIYAVLAHLRRHLHLLHEGFDVLHGVVGGGIQLMDAVGAAFLERYAGLAFPAGLHLRSRIGTVDHFGENARRGGFAHATRAAEEVGMGQLPPPDGVGQRSGNGILANQAFERIRPVFPGRHNVFAHSLQR